MVYFILNHMTTSEETKKEKKIISDMLDKFSESERHVFNSFDGIICIYLGQGKPPLPLIGLCEKAKEVVKKAFGEKLKKTFGGLHIYFVNKVIGGGGKAYSGANAIIIDADKALLTIAQAEEVLGPKGAQILDPGDWERVRDKSAFSGETTMIHEIGHILQAKTNSKTDSTPTKYAKKNEWEAYAESFLYYCYGIPMEGNGEKVIKKDIASL